MLKPALATVLLVLASAFPVIAQEPSPSRIAAAEELLRVTNARQVMEESMESMLQEQVAANPMLRELEPVMRDFFGRYVTWSAVKDEYARMYATRFTEAELREIVAFYHTPVGQKLAATTPELTVEGQRLGARLVEENSAELERMIMEAMGGG